jgi:hypothetical protein
MKNYDPTERPEINARRVQGQLLTAKAGGPSMVAHVLVCVASLCVIATCALIWAGKL